MERTFNAKYVNEVINHPSVWPFVAQGAAGALDVTSVVANQANVTLTCEGGALVFVCHEPGVYEVHTQFLEDFRGAYALERTEEALDFMFTRTDAMELQSKVPANNAPARGLVRAIHGRKDFSREKAWLTSEEVLVDVDYYTLDFPTWRRTARNLAEEGEKFHLELERQKAALGLPNDAHAHDEAHDRAVGAAGLMMTRGQVVKGITLYNRWARFAGYAEIRLINVNPMLLDIQNCYLWLKGDTFEVMPCQ